MSAYFKPLPWGVRCIGHLKTILRHKLWVCYYCFRLGIPIQGILHDLSKFAPVEFFEGVKYYNGRVSPIITAKQHQGYSNAWFHHKGRNKHHYEYWMDNFDKGGTNVLMPYKYAVEQICDYLGAGRAYQKKAFTFQKELEWWQNRLQNPIAMHPALQNFTTYCLVWMSQYDTLIPKHIMKTYYETAVYHDHR